MSSLKPETMIDSPATDVEHSYDPETLKEFWTFTYADGHALRVDDPETAQNMMHHMPHLF